ncbi:MAG: cobalamin B12-binding domain-containing protein [Gammaproteobacteria bacterium]|nr:cobalamin B12-binding domain-containing protein [Gammaproteobacteria bacterium]
MVSSSTWSGPAGPGLPPHPGRRSPEEDDGSDCHVLATEQLGMLAQAIESEIIPRLMMAYRADMEALSPYEGNALGGLAEASAAAEPRSKKAAVDREDVLELTRLVLEAPAAAARDHCADLQQQGVPLVQILLNLLAPAARELGELWEADEVDFTSVTIALCSLQQLMRELTRSVDPDWEDQARIGNRRVLLAPFPGEQHTFGVLMVSEFFQRAGWEVVGHGALTGQELLRIASGEWFAIIGVSIASDTVLADVTALIEKLREVSKNRRVSVLVGGRPFTADPDLFRKVGADATAADAESALEVAEELLETVS